VMNGAGKVNVGGGGRGGAAESAAIRAGDAIPLQLGDVHSFENTGSEPLEFLIVGVARDMSKRVDTIEIGAGGGRGPGR
jgi:mannose-6-phosphate isomerase-like protein (cupin superfamily)